MSIRDQQFLRREISANLRGGLFPLLANPLAPLAVVAPAPLPRREKSPGLCSLALQARLDLLASHVAVLDETGTIVLVNRAWRAFAQVHGLDDEHAALGANYLEVCDDAQGPGAADALLVARGIRDLLRGQYVRFHYHYPAHHDGQRQWYAVRATRQMIDGQPRIVVSHERVQ